MAAFATPERYAYQLLSLSSCSLLLAILLCAGTTRCCFLYAVERFVVGRSVEGRNWPISAWATLNAPKNTKNTERIKSTEKIRNAPKNPAKA